jgi:F0F1-type ATP synthase delta subunit
MRIKDYVQATYETLGKTGDARHTLANLTQYLERRGLTSLYPRILRGLMEKLHRSSRMGEARLIVAREKDAHDALHAAKEHADTFGTVAKSAVHVDPHLIGGFILEQNGKRLDKSYKRVLLDTYRKLTS